MFDLDRWREIFQSINKNKLRSVMSGFTVAFAILLFTLLFGIVSGLKNTFEGAFVDSAANSMIVRVWKTTKPFKGLQSGRRIQLKNPDYEYLADKYDSKIDLMTAKIFKNFSISYDNKQDNYSVTAVHPDHQFLEKTLIDEGRYINQLDINESSKVIVIGRLIKSDLFGEKPALGKRVNVGGISYKVIGIFSDDGGDNEERVAYIPVTTAQKLYGNNEYLNQIRIGYNQDLNLDEAIAFGNLIERDMRSKLDIHPDDQSALSVRNMAEGRKGVDVFMIALFFIVVFVGSGTLIAGIIGISNIMIFVIKERTKEFGIRKALGAKPSSIVGMVVQESVLITTIAGYLGLTLGTYILSLIGNNLEKDYFIKDPSVSQGLVIGATIVLIISGLIAALVPARKASQIKPVVALRAD
ncbi:ABC transporter permease [Flavobacteriaceae bacterium]|jgi:putative ABC transport system permease protein|nr:ABC transporter permease [Flavobacteriaceae bacterium]MDB2418543.1 ABC transporter permease [Flavobacteriaceae bacterium]MDB2658387.1 ABC transporter permease [Flavobacteriaceae bacterium]MDB2674467.1 ABC transporter permease [Flavobacteriaceae bacterium]|tara:strand:+ start:2056 stop:3288 length:1233 start_codon:yes stop_codon:yes gene_type:complete